MRSKKTKLKQTGKPITVNKPDTAAAQALNQIGRQVAAHIIGGKLRGVMRVTYVSQVKACANKSQIGTKF